MPSDAKIKQDWFGGVVFPLTRAQFFEDYFERKALHIRCNFDQTDGSLSEGDVLRLTKGDPALAQRVEAVISGQQIEVLKAGPSEPADVQDVEAALENGATVRLLGVQTGLPGVKLWADRLAVEFGGSGHANAYLTPAQTPGVAAHYDTHDVLVHQVSGSKHWSVYIPVTDDQPFLPLPSETGRPIDTSKLAKQSFTLQPGEMLYIPRGAAHATVAGDHQSVHITYGIQPVRWRDRMLDELLSLAEDDSFFRRAVRAEREAEFQKHRDRLLAQMMVSAVSRSDPPNA